MATITTADFKNGIGLRIKDKVVTIVEFQHVKPGKGGAFVRYKTKDIKTGRVVENTCNAGTKFESVMLSTREMQYLYNDGNDFIFMDNETYEQVPCPRTSSATTPSGSRRTTSASFSTPTMTLWA